MARTREKEPRASFSNLQSVVKGFCRDSSDGIALRPIEPRTSIWTSSQTTSTDDVHERRPQNDVHKTTFADDAHRCCPHHFGSSHFGSGTGSRLMVLLVFCETGARLHLYQDLNRGLIAAVAVETCCEGEVKGLVGTCRRRS